MPIMVNAKLKKETQVKIWPEAVNCSGLLENAMLQVDQNEPTMETWTWNIMRNFLNPLMQFGRIGYVAKKFKIKGKMT